MGFSGGGVKGLSCLGSNISDAVGVLNQGLAKVVRTTVVYWVAVRPPSM